MKKILIIASVLMLAIESFAFIGFGVQGGMDLIKVDAFKKDFDILEGVTYSLERDEISNPIEFGVHGQLDLPVIPIGIELGFSMAMADYKWKAPATINGLPLEIPGYDSKDGYYSEEFTYMRASIDATLKYYLIEFPPALNTLGVYLAGGVGINFITPLVSEEVFLQEMSDISEGATSAEIDLEELTKSSTVFGGSFGAGVRIKVPVAPISFNIDYRYVITPENDYKDETNKFSTIKGSLNFYI
ncbi:MAG: outer membrane beta-barrel protein [Candidatus Delongbacteria bacterium]|nr:outer membrane beta-barrel protein [Candidatus Delongbacteria bacterium]MBN2834200.1 outer membrane beta-barrel protein [Candidatus Delongbacteria bacterium]